MKSTAQQIFIVTGLFFLSLSATLAISWGISQTVFSHNTDTPPKQTIFYQQKIEIAPSKTLKHAIKLLTPKIK